jgi:epsin
MHFYRPNILAASVTILYYFAAKKVSLADVGIVGGLNDGSDEREKGPPATFYMGRAMGSGSGLGMYGGAPSQQTTGDDIFSNFGSQNYQFGGFQK